jgi:hypothetical protein
MGYRKKTEIFLLVIITFGVISGCTTPITRLYEGPEKPRSEVAILCGPNLSIDGKELCGEIHLLPGTYVVSPLSEPDVKLSFRAEAGHSYALEPYASARPIWLPKFMYKWWGIRDATISAWTVKEPEDMRKLYRDVEDGEWIEWWGENGITNRKIHKY